VLSWVGPGGLNTEKNVMPGAGGQDASCRPGWGRPDTDGPHRSLCRPRELRLTLAELEGMTGAPERFTRKGGGGVAMPQ